PFGATHDQALIVDVGGESVRATEGAKVKERPIRKQKSVRFGIIGDGGYTDRLPSVIDFRDTREGSAERADVLEHAAAQHKSVSVAVCRCGLASNNTRAIDPKGGTIVAAERAYIDHRAARVDERVGVSIRIGRFSNDHSTAVDGECGAI